MARLISDEIVRSVLDPASARAEALAALEAQAAGRTGLSEPRSLFLRSKGPQWSYHLKGAYLETLDVAGFRIGATAQGAPQPVTSQLLVLTRLGTAAPLALICSAGLGELRVGAAIAITIELLRSSTARTLALIGTGRLAKSTVRAIQATMPFPEIRMVSRSWESAARFCAELVQAGVVGLAAVGGIAEACLDADVILTLTTASEALIRAEWCKQGSLVVTAGGRRECEDQVILQADKIFVDDWEQCTILGDLAALYREGKIDRADLAGSLCEIVAGKVPGRANDRERIVAVPQGLTLLDVALGHFVYRVAMEKGLGVDVDWP